MNKLTHDERANYERQSEIAHLMIGLHEARLRAGHPFGIETVGLTLGMKQAKGGPRELHAFLQANPRVSLDLSEGDPEQSPITRITQAVTASMWDTYNQIHGILDPSVSAEYQNFLHDPALKNLIDASNETGARLKADIEQTFRERRYFGAQTMHAGLEVGISFMTKFAAIKDALPPDHPFDPTALARIIGRTSSASLTVATMEFHLLPELDPSSLLNLHDTGSPIGVSQKRIDDFIALADHGCIALRPMGPVSREILQRHHMYRQELDGPPAVKIVSDRIITYVKQQLGELRVMMDFHDSGRLPALDRHIINRTLLDAVKS